VPVKIALPRNEIVWLYEEEKWPQAALAREFRVAESTIRSRLREWGVQIRPNSEWYVRPHKPGGPLNVSRNGLGTRDRNGRPARIHQGCWEAYCGAIQPGYVIHHIDGNSLNNGIENLACIKLCEHHVLHRSAERVGSLADAYRDAVMRGAVAQAG
jgi:hypothetical protein